MGLFSAEVDVVDDCNRTASETILFRDSVASLNYNKESSSDFDPEVKTESLIEGMIIEDIKIEIALDS